MNRVNWSETWKHNREGEHQPRFFLGFDESHFGLCNCSYWVIPRSKRMREFRNPFAWEFQPSLFRSSKIHLVGSSQGF